MPVTVEVDAQSKLARRTYSGDVTSGDLLESICEYQTIPAFQPHFNEVMDFREVKSIAAPMDDIRRCALTPVPFSNDSKRIIVAPQAAIYGVARMYQILGEEVHPNIYVVRTMEEALELLLELTVKRTGNSRRA
jgi:hypothetical protein